MSATSSPAPVVISRPPPSPPPPPPASFRTYSQSNCIIFGFGMSILIPPASLRPNANIPLFVTRTSFSFIFAGASYVIGTDVRNGTGIATAWSLSYLLMNLRQSLRAPRHPLSLGLSAGAMACAGLYGTEYFLYQDLD